MAPLAIPHFVPASPPATSPSLLHKRWSTSCRYYDTSCDRYRTIIIIIVILVVLLKLIIIFLLFRRHQKKKARRAALTQHAYTPSTTGAAAHHDTQTYAYTERQSEVDAPPAYKQRDDNDRVQVLERPAPTLSPEVKRVV